MKLIVCKAFYQTNFIWPKLILLKECFIFPWKPLTLSNIHKPQLLLSIDIEYSPKCLSIAKKTFPGFFFQKLSGLPSHNHTALASVFQPY